MSYDKHESCIKGEWHDDYLSENYDVNLELKYETCNMNKTNHHEFLSKLYVDQQTKKVADEKTFFWWG